LEFLRIKTMHMTDTLISPAVGVTMCAISTAAIAYSVYSIKKDEVCKKKIPIIGVMSAFILVAQTLNFAIPGTSSSGHIIGGILLAAMLGCFPALLSMSAVLAIQSLFFADGGLLALGCNIFNMGVVPCLIIYPLIFKPLVNKSNIAAPIFAAVAGLQIGAFCVVMETWASGITELPFSAFAAAMLPIHLAIGFAEGIIIAVILRSAYRISPEVMESALSRTALKSDVSTRNILAAFTVAALFAGGVLSLFASSNPDGLEWAIQKIAGI
jgi:cobalt/nickel transport system permease protein